MPKIELTLPEPHPGQWKIKNSTTRFKVANCGRRWGKTLLGEDVLVNGETLEYPQAWFAPTYKLMLDVWRDLRNVLQPITKRASIQERRIELVTGGVIDMWSLDNQDAGRGRKYRRIVVDEAALIRNLLEVWNKVLRPTLADYAGDAYFLSTPKGHNGFKVIYDWGQDPLMEDWQSWSMPTGANPYIPPDEIEGMRKELPELVFAQEIMAQFIDDAGGVFRRVMDAATATEQHEAVEGHEYIIGVDWGQMNDFTVYTVLDTYNNEVVYVDRFNQIDYIIQRDRLKALWQRFNRPPILAELNSIGRPNIENLTNEGLAVQPFTTTNASKAEAIQALQGAFERGEIKIVPDDVLVSELQAYEADRLPSGLLRYGAPEGMHDDCVMSLAIAYQGVAAHSWLAW